MSWHGMAIHYVICSHLSATRVGSRWLGRAMHPETPMTKWRLQWRPCYAKALLCGQQQFYQFYTTVAMPPILIPTRPLFAQATIESSRNEGENDHWIYKLEWNRVWKSGRIFLFCLLWPKGQVNLICRFQNHRFRASCCSISDSLWRFGKRRRGQAQSTIARWQKSRFQDQLAATRTLLVWKMKKQNAAQCHRPNCCTVLELIFWTF